MSNSKSEQKVNIKFCVKLKKSALETYNLLKEAYGKDCLPQTSIVELHKQFSEGKSDVTPVGRLNRLRSSVTTKNINNVKNKIAKNRKKGMHTVAKKVKKHYEHLETFHRILKQELNKKKGPSKKEDRVELLMNEEQNETEKGKTTDK